MKGNNEFLYGLSCSAFQTEGDDGTQGRGRSVWDEYCDRENTIYMGQKILYNGTSVFGGKR